MNISATKRRIEVARAADFAPRRVAQRGLEPTAMPAFVLHMDERDRRAYRRAIERWETEGGATLDRDVAGRSEALALRRT